METEPRQTWDNHARPINWTRWGSPIAWVFRYPGFALSLSLSLRQIPSVKAGIRDSKEKWEGNSGLKVCTGCGIPRITIGIKRLREHLGRDDDVRTPIGDQALSYKNLRNVDCMLSSAIVKLHGYKFTCCNKPYQLDKQNKQVIITFYVLGRGICCLWCPAAFAPSPSFRTSGFYI